MSILFLLVFYVYVGAIFSDPTLPLFKSRISAAQRIDFLAWCASEAVGMAWRASGTFGMAWCASEAVDIEWCDLETAGIEWRAS